MKPNRESKSPVGQPGGGGNKNVAKSPGLSSKFKLTSS